MYYKKIGFTALIALMSGLGSVYLQCFNSQVLAQAPQPSIPEAESLVNQGIELAEKNQFDAALKSWQSALIIYQKLDDRFSQGSVLNHIGLAYRNLGQYQKALEFLQKALEIFKQAQGRAGIGGTLNNLGLVYSNMSQYKKALQLYEQALDIKKEFEDRRGQATLLNNIGTAYRNIGQYQRALTAYQQALNLFKSVIDKSGEGTTLNNIGGVYDHLGQYSQAWEVYQQALKLLISANDKTGEGTTLNNIGVLYRNIGQYEDALKYYEQALEILKQSKRTFIATTLNNIGEVKNSQGKYNEGLDFYKKSLVIRKEIQDKIGEGTTLNSIGAAYRNLKEYKEALDFYQQALAVRIEINDRSGKATTLNNMGNVYLDLGQHNKSLELYDEALTIYKEVGDRADIGTTLNNIGSAYLVMGNYQKATENLYQAIEVLDSLRPGLSDANKVAIFETQDHTYRSLQKALTGQNKIEEALEVAERGRARAYVELLAKRLSVNPDTKATISAPTIKQIQQIAKTQKATLVEYSIISDRELFIWVVQPTGKISFRRVDLTSMEASLHNFVFTSRRLIGAGGRGGGLVPIGSQTTPSKVILQKLHSFLIEPIADLLPNNPENHVIFIPHKSLFLIPFAALQDTKDKYLIQKHTISTAPAIQVLDFTYQLRQKVSGKGALVVGNPTIEPQVSRNYEIQQLVGAEQEAKEIAQILNTKAIIGDQPTKSNILQRMPNARIIHLATHGLLDDVKKLGIPGAIVLAPAGKDNGLLTASEILDLKLNAELVVLSACDTGQGKLTGDGVVGLSRSLITAGAPSIIVTLWKIPDTSSALLMTEFYKNLQRRSDKATALRAAMLTTINKYPNPIDWAAFTLIGEPD